MLFCANHERAAEDQVMNIFLIAFLAAQLAVSANDNKVMLVDGVNTPVPNPLPDTVTILDIGASPPKIVSELRAPTSIVGPPHSVAVTPDQSIALVTASTKIDPSNPKLTLPDDKVTVIDLKTSPPGCIDHSSGWRWCGRSLNQPCGDVGTRG